MFKVDMSNRKVNPYKSLVLLKEWGKGCLIPIHRRQVPFTAGAMKPKAHSSGQWQTRWPESLWWHHRPNGGHVVLKRPPWDVSFQPLDRVPGDGRRRSTESVSVPADPRTTFGVAGEQLFQDGQFEDFVFWDYDSWIFHRYLQLSCLQEVFLTGNFPFCRFWMFNFWEFICSRSTSWLTPKTLAGKARRRDAPAPPYRLKDRDPEEGECRCTFRVASAAEWCRVPFTSSCGETRWRIQIWQYRRHRQCLDDHRSINILDKTAILPSLKDLGSRFHMFDWTINNRFVKCQG